MLRELEHCKREEIGRGTELECCFNICNKYWAMLKHDVANYKFEREDQEIEFFKTIKPLFTSELEYCGLRSYAELFKESTNDPVILKQFWLKEAMRHAKFIEDNSEFYQYYKNGNKENDETWFIRDHSDLSNFLSARPYDLDERAATSHDYLVARIIALKKYAEYVEREIDNLISK